MRDLVAIEKEGLELAAECVQKINAAAARAAQLEGIADFSANIVIADDDYLWELNRQFRGIDRATDVLSFPQYEALAEIPGQGEIPLGDVVISRAGGRGRAVFRRHFYLYRARGRSGQGIWQYADPGAVLSGGARYAASDGIRPYAGAGRASDAPKAARGAGAELNIR